MGAWLEKLMQGIDPQSPDASLQIFWRIMGLVDWWQLLWLSLLFVVVGGLIGWYRGSFWRDVGLAAALGPVGWVVSFLLPPPTQQCSACRRLNPVKQSHCTHCGAALRGANNKAT